MDGQTTAALLAPEGGGAESQEHRRALKAGKVSKTTFCPQISACAMSCQHLDLRIRISRIVSCNFSCHETLRPWTQGTHIVSSIGKPGSPTKMEMQCHDALQGAAKKPWPQPAGSLPCPLSSEDVLSWSVLRKVWWGHMKTQGATV